MSAPIALPIPPVPLWWLITQAPTPPAATGPDPTPFLAAIASTSAALVAITGGLLVARFVSIASEQEGADKLVEDADERLKTARTRAALARNALRNRDVFDFFDARVLHVIGEGERDVATLRQIGDPTMLTDEQITESVQSHANEFARARATLAPLLADRDHDDFMDWKDFQRLHYNELPQTFWSAIWQDAYEGMLLESLPQPEPRRTTFDGSYMPNVSALLNTVRTPPEYVIHGLNQRAQLQSDVDRTEQQAQDIEAELGRLTRQRSAIQRPKGLGSGLLVLGFFTLVGIIVPLFVMSRGPERLTAGLGEMVFYLFLVGLLALLAHMAWLALRLSNRRKSEDTPRKVKLRDVVRLNRQRQKNSVKLGQPESTPTTEQETSSP